MDDEETTTTEDEEIKNPSAKIKAQQEQINRLQRKIGKLETNPVSEDDVYSARMEAAFFRQLMTSSVAISDLEAAWDLGTAKGYFDNLKIADDGTVEGMDKALEKLVARYPSLAATDDDDEDDEKPTGGRAVKAPKKSNIADDASLRKRFPALRGRGGALGR